MGYKFIIMFLVEHYRCILYEYEKVCTALQQHNDRLIETNSRVKCAVIFNFYCKNSKKRNVAKNLIIIMEIQGAMSG